MGSQISSNDSKVNQQEKTNWIFPASIPLDDIIMNNSNARRKMSENLRDHNYAILSTDQSKLGNEIYNSLEQLNQDMATFFSLEQTQKNKFVDEMGQNLGYVFVKGIREYLKLRISDPDSMWPQDPPLLKEHFLTVFNALKTVAWSCFESLTQFEPDSKLNNKETNKAIQEFVDIKSSLSLIHYFPNEDKEKCACGQHEDTGLITLGGFSSCPGLIIFDRVKNDWVEVEKLVSKRDLICFIGQKIPLFSGSTTWSATTHKVEIPLSTDRNALVFLLDVAK